MGYLKYMREAWKRPKDNSELWRQRLIKWRKEPVTVRIERPTRIDRARSLGYKAKKGFIVVRQRVLRGGHKRTRPTGRRSKHSGIRLNLDLSYQTIAEQRAAKKYVNCEVLNSYWAAKDGKHYWYEIILIDKESPSVKSDKEVSWISKKQHNRRVFRGLTGSSKKSRGLRRKGKGAEKLRPSRTANLRKRGKI